MKRFIFKILLLSIPILLLFLPPIIILKGSGENFTEINSIIKKNDKYLIGYAYNEDNYGYLKWATLNQKPKYQIIALGSSRVLQFRNSMFNTSFYNAGYTISRINDFRKFLQSIPKEKYPRYLLLGFDQWMFNTNWDNVKNSKRENYWEKSFSYQPKFSTYISVYKNIIRGKYGFGVINIAPLEIRIGLNSIVNNKGFRNDGSINYGTQIYKLISNDKSANDYKFQDTYKRIKNGNRRFEYGKVVNKRAIEELKRLLSYCKNNNIKVIGIIPPFANSVYEEMIKSNNYDYLNNLPDEIIPIFNKYDFEFYYYPSASYCNSSDKEFIDGFHGGEVVYCNILIDILKNKSVLKNITNIKKLENDKSNKKNRYVIYE